ncbi:MAG: type IV toxin-antitoxin system AbiEi family antitoxin domain-containing protein [Solirubrobacterales bacterium]
MDAKRQSRRVDAAIAALAERQHGLVARAQLVGLGLGHGAIDYRVRCGRLHNVHRGVYAVGHRVLSREGRWMAAVLVAGRDAALSHRSAAALWGVHKSARGRIEVSVPRAVRSHAGLQVHVSRVRPDEVTALHGIPVTTPPRTLLDLAGAVGRRQLERAIEEAEVLQLTDALSLEDLVLRHPRRRGAAAIRAVLAAGRVGATVTRSELEERFLVFLEDFDLPRPEVNVSLWVSDRWIEADCLWREQRVIVELDGHASHATDSAFERDRARDRTLQADGWRVLRITWRQLHREPDAILRDLTALLIRERGRSTRPSRI